MSNTFKRNPYEGVDWKKVEFLPTCTHIHCRTPQVFTRVVNEGMKFFQFANYYPSAPIYPLRDIRENTFRMGQNGTFKDGVYHPERADFTPLTGITEPGEPLYPNIPEDFLEAPNAEYHWFSDYSIYLHITAPGSTFSCGHFDLKDEFGLCKAGYQYGCPMPWKEAFTKILDSLITPDGGGIVIAHPQWSHLNVEAICEMLDFDERVMGIELVNYGCENDYTGVCESLWDEILRTGRRCLGFCVQDHLKEARWQGKIVLLTEDHSARGALKAMREGCFYGTILDDVRFEFIHFDGHRFQAACDHEMFFQLISRRGVESEQWGKLFSFDVQESQYSDFGYLRLDARYGKRNDKLYTQPIWL